MTQPNISDWVRNFTIDFVEHRNVSEQLDISTRHFRVFYDPSHHYFVELLARRFGERGATASFETYDNPGQVTGQAQPPGTSLYTVSLLPREIPMGSSREKLQRMIYRLHCAVATTKISGDQNLGQRNPIVLNLGELDVFGTQGITDCGGAVGTSLSRRLPALCILGNLPMLPKLGGVDRFAEEFE